MAKSSRDLLRKTILVVKNEFNLPMARLLLEKTGVTISLQGERHLEAVIGSKEFKVQYVRNEVSGWNEICGVRVFRNQ